ncbi:MAG TPA: hypothetical protein VF511_02045, partial [Chthoniobacterales bacterium]
GYSAIVVSSGTSTSTRGRGQPNSLNVIRIDGSGLTIERRVWQPTSQLFDVLSIEQFHRGEDGWVRE